MKLLDGGVAVFLLYSIFVLAFEAEHHEKHAKEAKVISTDIHPPAPKPSDTPEPAGETATVPSVKKPEANAVDKMKAIIKVWQAEIEKHKANAEVFKKIKERKAALKRINEIKPKPKPSANVYIQKKTLKPVVKPMLSAPKRSIKEEIGDK